MSSVFPHLHWFGRVVWTDVSEGTPPYKECRCGATKSMGDPCRWGVGMDGEWFYGEAMYE